MNTDKENLECTQTDVHLQSVYTSNQETPFAEAEDSLDTIQKPSTNMALKHDWQQHQKSPL